jgi:hypothetical protein
MGHIWIRLEDLSAISLAPTPSKENIMENQVPYSVLVKYQTDSLYQELLSISEGIASSKQSGDGKGRARLMDLLVVFRKRFAKLLALYQIPNVEKIMVLLFY